MSAIRDHPLRTFFALAYTFSLIALLAIGLPSVEEAPTRWSVTPLVIVPMMVVGVGLSGFGLTVLVDGRGAAGKLLRSARQPATPRRYYAALLIPPAAILAALLILDGLVSPVFRPNLFPVGIFAGLLAGFCEEFGWSGFAYPRMRTRFGQLPAALLLGILWALWHFPVVDSLGVAHPHGHAWPLFFLSFILILVALRVLIAWVYTATDSLQLAQLMHASSTGFLVVLGASHVTPGQEASWYGLYGAFLALAAGAVVARSHPSTVEPAVPAVSAS
jgi:membrane protease YdiL (CAAX protease family)